MKILATFLMTFLVVFPIVGQETDSDYVASDRVVRIDVGLVSSIRDIQVPARVKGFLSNVHFKEGDFVTKDDVIAQLDTTSIDGELAAANIRLRNAQLQADDNTPVEYAKASFATANQEYQTDRVLIKTRAVTQQELERKRLTAKQAELQVTRSKAQKEIDSGAVSIEEQAVKSVNELKKRHSIFALFSGQIMSIDRKEGEFVQEGQTVVRLIDLSQVKVEGRVNSSEINADEMRGKPVTVFLKLARGKIVIFKGSVKSIGLDYQPSSDGSNTFIVQAEVENKQDNGQWLLHPGAGVAMEIELDQP